MTLKKLGENLEAPGVQVFHIENNEHHLRETIDRHLPLGSATEMILGTE